MKTGFSSKQKTPGICCFVSLFDPHLFSKNQVSDFLKMDGVPPSHEQMKAEGLLHEWTPLPGRVKSFVFLWPDSSA